MDKEPRVHEYTLPGDWKVLVGRSDADNDMLSIRFARPDDWWFHVRGMPGSHVILQGQTGAEPDREILKQAAAIAAYHSKARTGGVIAVSATRARYVTKPKGAKPGTVHIRKEVVFKVRPGLPE
jgi:predicted ribosome quality control (RQC) complex YloA/Tae2 family protein